MEIIKKIKLKRLIARGLKIGKDVKIEKGVIIDSNFAYLVEIGDNVTLAPYAHILAHDASTKPFTGYTKIGNVTIGSNVFIGAKVVILPNVKIGNNVVIGAGSIVTKSIPDNSVACGNPARIISTLDEYIEKNKKFMKNNNLFGKDYLIKNTNEAKKDEVKENVKKYGISYIV